MRRLLIGSKLVLISVILSGGLAQAQQPDTLDARGYFPLAVGNEWEYRLDLIRPASIDRPEDESRVEYLRYRVAADGAGPEGDRFALVQDRLSGEGSLLFRDTSAVRYDVETACVLALQTDAHGQPHEEPFPFFACDLDLPFHDYDDPFEDYPHGWYWEFATDEEFVLPTLLDSDEHVRVKLFANVLYGFTALHGVGFVTGGGGCHPCNLFSDYDTWTLVYAKVGGRTYGAREVGLAASPRPPTPTRLVVFPNPTSGPVAILGLRPSPAGSGLADASVEVYDLSGRRVRSFPIPASGATSLDLSGLPGGLYVLRAGASVGRVIVE